MTSAAVVLCVTTVFLAPLPLLLLRRNEGRGAMFIACVIGAAILVPLSSPAVVISFLAAVVLTAVLSECENLNIGYSYSVLVTVLSIAGAGFLLMSVAREVMGFQPIAFFKEQIALSLNQVKLPAEVKIDKDMLLNQVPSALIMMIIFAVWVNSVLVRRVERLLNWVPVKQNHFFKVTDFLSWRLPDEFVWFALAAAACNFLDVQPAWLKLVASNAFNVSVMLYFFQGLAVVVNFMETKKVTAFWRMLAYLLIFTQLFLGVAFLGFVDLWMSFRNRTKADKSHAI